MTTDPPIVEQRPTHYCVICAARWLKHEDKTWSVLTPCGPCCDNQPMTAPLIEMLPDGTVNGKEHDRIRRAYRDAELERQVEAYRGIACSICDEPFENHHDWYCPKRVTPRFTFPKLATYDAQHLEPLRREIFEEAAKVAESVTCQYVLNNAEPEMRERIAAAIRLRGEERG